MEWRRGSLLQCTKYFNTRLHKERIVLARDSGPRPEARKEEKGKRKVTKVTPEFAGVVENRTHIGILSKGSWNKRHQRGCA